MKIPKIAFRFKQKSEFEYYQLKLLLPKLWFNSKVDDTKYTDYVGLDIQLNTGFHISCEPNVSWEINFKVLGFGLSLYRQWGY